MNNYLFSTGNKFNSTDACNMAPANSCAFSDIVITSGTVVNAVSVFVIRIISIISSVLSIVRLLGKPKSKTLSMDILI